MLIGCRTPNKSRDARIDDQDELNIRSAAVINPDPTALEALGFGLDEDEPEDVRIGIDIACTWEPPRTPDLSTAEKLEEWVEVFGEMFSTQEQWDMVRAPVGELQNINEWEWKARRFYTYWALKEAYIKMVGEGLLAPWLEDLEFRNVPVPLRPIASGTKWTMLEDEQVNELDVLFKDKDISRTMHTTLEAFEDTFLIATMTRGVADTPADRDRWEAVDLFGDIELCATGECRCLS